MGRLKWDNIKKNKKKKETVIEMKITSETTPKAWDSKVRCERDQSYKKNKQEWLLSAMKELSSSIKTPHRTTAHMSSICENEPYYYTSKKGFHAWNCREKTGANMMKANLYSRKQWSTSVEPRHVRQIIEFFSDPSHFYHVKFQCFEHKGNILKLKREKISCKGKKSIQFSPRHRSEPNVTETR